MGHAAPAPIVMPTRLDVERSRYVKGAIDIKEFERRAGRLVFAGQDVELVELAPPRSPFAHPSMETVLR